MSTCKIFLCHRRGDAIRHVGKLREKLIKRFGEDAVYYGSHLSLNGENFPADSVRALIEARVVLILIGPKWASLDNLELLHEVHGEPDPVRRSLALALTRHGMETEEVKETKAAPMLLPILLDGASIPDKASLPKDLRNLTLFTPINFSDQDWSTRSELLMRRLEQTLEPARKTDDTLVQRLFNPVNWRWPSTIRNTARRISH